VAAAPDDLAAAAAVAAEAGVPVVARGAASSLAGQAIGPGIVVDCFKLDRILAIDGDARTARVQPGVVQAALNAAAAPLGLEFGPDTSTVTGHHRRHGGNNSLKTPVHRTRARTRSCASTAPAGGGQ
jgi:FAD/FMN-containing dehydrogenase